MIHAERQQWIFTHATQWTEPVNRLRVFESRERSFVQLLIEACAKMRTRVHESQSCWKRKSIARRHRKPSRWLEQIFSFQSWLDWIAIFKILSTCFEPPLHRMKQAFWKKKKKLSKYLWKYLPRQHSSCENETALPGTCTPHACKFYTVLQERVIFCFIQWRNCWAEVQFIVLWKNWL